MIGEWRALQKDLPDDMIKDWTKVRDAIVAVHEVILYAAATMDTDAFANILSYPITLDVIHEDSENVWERWTLHTPEEVKKVFPYIMKHSPTFIMQAWSEALNHCAPNATAPQQRPPKTISKIQSL